MSESNRRLSRRGLFAGAATAGTVAAAASLLPGVREAAQAGRRLPAVRTCPAVLQDHPRL